MKKWHICLMFPISSDMLHSHLLIKVFQSVHGNKSMIYFSFNFFFSIFLKVNQFSSRFTFALAVLWTLTLMITNVLLLWEPVLECPKDLLSKKSKVSYFVHMYLIFSFLWIWKKNPKGLQSNTITSINTWLYFLSLALFYQDIFPFIMTCFF